jgi:hypothetical protein
LPTFAHVEDRVEVGPNVHAELHRGRPVEGGPARWRNPTGVVPSSSVARDEAAEASTRCSSSSNVFFVSKAESPNTNPIIEAVGRDG